MLRKILFHRLVLKHIYKEKRKIIKFKRLKKWHTSFVLNYLQGTPIEKELAENKIRRGLIVSLTVKPGREESVHLVIKSLLNQKVLPEKIVLWLASDEFQREQLPPQLIRLQGRIVEIDFTHENLRPFNKILPALKKYPDFTVITADDDILYPPWWIQDLLEKHDAYPEEIICHRAYEMKWEQLEMAPYSSWSFCKRANSSKNLFPTGVSGILYFPGCFTSEVLNSEAISNHSPTADDVWLKIQSILNSIKIRQVECYSQHFPMIPGSQGSALQKTNKHTNDKQLSALMKYYKLSYSDFQDH